MPRYGEKLWLRATSQQKDNTLLQSIRLQGIVTSLTLQLSSAHGRLIINLGHIPIDHNLHRLWNQNIQPSAHLCFQKEYLSTFICRFSVLSSFPSVYFVSEGFRNTLALFILYGRLELL